MTSEEEDEEMMMSHLEDDTDGAVCWITFTELDTLNSS